MACAVAFFIFLALLRYAPTTHSRPLCPRHFWCLGRSDSAQTGAGHLAPASSRSSASSLSPSGRSPPRLGRRPVSPKDARILGRIRRPARRQCTGCLPRQVPLRARRPRRPSDLRRAQSTTRSSRPRMRHRGQSLLLLLSAAADLPRHRRAARARWPQLPTPRPSRLVPHHRRKALWPQLRLGPRTQPSAALGLCRRADLPHRPLPRQGDRAEHPRLSPRQFNF